MGNEPDTLYTALSMVLLGTTRHTIYSIQLKLKQITLSTEINKLVMQWKFESRFGFRFSLS